MAHFAIVSPPLAGHLNALQALGTHLVERGHRVTVLGPADARRWIWPASAIGFATIGETTHPPGSVEAVSHRMGRLRGLFGVGTMIRGLARDTQMVARDAPAVLEQIGADALIVDQLEPAGGVVAQGLDLPYMSVATALPINRDPDVPPVFLGWDYRTGQRARERNAGGHRVADWLMRAQHRVIAEAASRFGLDARARPSDWLSPVLDVSQTVPSIDFPRAEPPRQLHHVGPLRLSQKQTLPFERDGRPLAFASLGTLQGARLELFETIAKAVAERDHQLVLVHCGRLDRHAVSRLETDPSFGRPVVRDFVPQSAVLAQADLAVLHGGFNTVLDALRQAVPIVVMPLAFEQPAIAARLERAGVAQRVSPWRVRPKRITDAIDLLVHEDRLDARLAATAIEIEEAGGASRAADLAERILLGLNVTSLDAERARRAR